MNKKLVAGVLFLLASAAAFAKPKEKTYNNSPQQVFRAALKTARERQVVTYVDEKDLMFTFSTGESMMSMGFIANASVESKDDGKSVLLLNVQNKNNGKDANYSFNAGDRMAKKFFAQVDQELADESTQKVAVHPEAPPIAVPASAKFVNSAPVAPLDGLVNVTSMPGGADVSVDGAFVGSTPAALRLTPGVHEVQVSSKGYQDWSRKLTVLAGSSVALDATLGK